MSHRTPFRAIAKRASALDQWIFAGTDRVAVEHGWQVLKPHLLTRIYRDPRWTEERDDGNSEPGRPS